MENLLPETNWLERAAYFFGRRDVFIIEGNSMLPTLKQGDGVFVKRRLKPKVGDIILFRHPFIQNLKVAKRVSEITAEGKFFVRGDNPLESTDSRSYGAISAKDVLGVAVCRFDGE